MLTQTYEGEAMKKSSVSAWHKQFKEVRMSKRKWRQCSTRVLFTLNSFHKAKRSTKLNYVETMKWLHEAVRRKGPELWPNDWILYHDNVSAHKVLSVK
jgi:transposase-like protein